MAGRISLVTAGALAAVLSSAGMGCADGIVFSNSGVSIRDFQFKSVAVGQSLPISELKRRFRSYKIRATTGEDCVVCAVLSKGASRVDVFYDAAGVRIVRIESTSADASDALGNKVGDSLRNAVGASARCFNGNAQTCLSGRPNLDRVAYVVEAGGGCALTGTEGQDFVIPACARIAGFQLLDHSGR